MFPISAYKTLAWNNILEEIIVLTYRKMFSTQAMHVDVHSAHVWNLSWYVSPAQSLLAILFHGHLKKFFFSMVLILDIEWILIQALLLWFRLNYSTCCLLKIKMLPILWEHLGKNWKRQMTNRKNIICT